jgi:hypothetical protein
LIIINRLLLDWASFSRGFLGFLFHAKLIVRFCGVIFGKNAASWPRFARVGKLAAWLLRPIGAGFDGFDGTADRLHVDQVLKRLRKNSNPPPESGEKLSRG